MTRSIDKCDVINGDISFVRLANPRYHHDLFVEAHRQRDRQSSVLLIRSLEKVVIKIVLCRL